MSTAASTPTLSNRNRIPCLMIAGVLGCLALCLGIVIVAAAGYLLLGPYPMAPLALARPQATAVPLALPSESPVTAPAPSPTFRAPENAPTLAPADLSAGPKWDTFQGVHAPFSVAYPSDWTVDKDNEAAGTVVFVSPDQTAAASVISLQAGPLPVDQAMDRINNQILSKNGAVNVISSNKNADGSITEELEYTSVALGGRVHSFARLLRVSDKYYLALFDVQVDQSAQFADTGKKFVDSLVVGQ